MIKKRGSDCVARKKRGPKRSILQVCEDWAGAFDAARRSEAHFHEENT